MNYASSNNLILRPYTGTGDFILTGTNLGIGVVNATSKLDVAGTGTFQGLKILSGASNGYVLTSDASGNARWAAASAGGSTGWTLSGNAIGANDFVGTTNAQPFIVKTNNIETARFYSSATNNAILSLT